MIDRLARWLADPAHTRWVYDHIFYQWWFRRGADFFNVGLAPVAPEVQALPEFSAESRQAQVYHEALVACRRAGTGLAPRSVLEISCGLGGGLAYLRHVFGDALLLGVDLSMQAARQSRHRSACEVVVADGQALPFADGAFDLIVNVEALHRMRLDLLLAECARLLAPRGALALLDFRGGAFQAVRAELASAARDASLEVAAILDLTPNLLRAVREDGARQQRLLRRTLPGFRRITREMLVLEGTQRHSGYQRGDSCYFVCVLRR